MSQARNYFLTHVSLIGLLTAMFVWPLMSAASVVLPTGCVAVGSHTTNSTFAIEHVVPDMASEVPRGQVAECMRVADQMAAADMGVGSTPTFPVEEVPQSANATYTDFYTVPISNSTGSMGSDGRVHGGGLLFEWYATSELSSDDWLVRVDAAGMAGGVRLWATDDFISVVQKEFGVAQCHAMRELSAKEQEMLAQAVATLPHVEIESVERPSCHACADGDYDTTMTVSHGGSTYQSNNFDLTQPPEVLKETMDMVSGWALAECPEVPLSNNESVVPPKPVPDSESEVTTEEEPIQNQRSIQQQIIALLQQILQLLQLR
jgi:hypothetical protein